MKEKETKFKESELVIVQKGFLGALDENPIDALDGELYRRIEKLVSWFVLRCPVVETTKLANPGCIGLFKSNDAPKNGSRANNRLKFDEKFLIPFGLDCTNFEFEYKRLAVKPAFIGCNLGTNEASVFDSLDERCACFVGKSGDSKEDSCIESVCRHIRNAFAHGRLAVKEIDGEAFIFMEDGSNPDKVEYDVGLNRGPKLEIRFRLLVKLSTLESWYEILQNGADLA